MSCRASAARLWEETQFDNKTVTSVDWLTYPILDITETPETIDVVLINRPDVAPSGAGEPTIRVVAAAIANAIFDATGVRIRRAPLTPGSGEGGAGIATPARFRALTSGRHIDGVPAGLYFFGSPPWLLTILLRMQARQPRRG